MAEKLKFTTALDIAGFAEGMARLENIGAASAARLSKVTAIGATAAAAAFAGGAVLIGRGVGKMFDAGRKLEVLARQTGASVQGIAILQTKFKEAGIDADGVGRVIARLQKSIAGLEDDENKGGASRLEKLGLSLAALQKMRPDQQLMTVGAAISRIADPAERSASAMQIFGRAGAELGALFNGDFAKIPPNLALNAQILARNAALFEQVAIKLERSGEVARSFFLGTAAAVATTLGPILDQFERLNLVVLGEKLGKSLANAGKMVVGAFQVPEAAYKLIENGLAYSFTQAGNVLLATVKVATQFFQNGMMAAFQGIGSAIISVLMRSFATPIAYLQAQLENTIEFFNSPARQTEKIVGRNKKAVSEAQQDVDFYKPGGANADTREYNNAVSRLTGATDQLANSEKALAKVRETEDKSLSESVATRQARILKEGVRFGLTDGGQTADQWQKVSQDKLQEAMAGASAAARNFKVDDVMGSGRYAIAAQGYAAKLQAQGGATLGSGTSLSRLEQVRLMAQAHMALASSHAPMGADPAAYMFMGHSGMPGSARTNATDPYTARVDAMRRGISSSQHTIGVGGALDGLYTGLGHAYGATGNIWSQMSGRVNKPNGDPQKDMVGHLKNLNDKMDRYWGEAGGGGGGGGATVTR